MFSPGGKRPRLPPGYATKLLWFNSASRLCQLPSQSSTYDTNSVVVPGSTLLSRRCPEQRATLHLLASSTVSVSAAATICPYHNNDSNVSAFQILYTQVASTSTTWRWSRGACPHMSIWKSTHIISPSCCNFHYRFYLINCQFMTILCHTQL